MWDEWISRRRLLALGGAAFASALIGGSVRGQGEDRNPLRIGCVLPLPGGGEPLRNDHQQLAGELAREGAQLAEAHLGGEVARDGRRLEVLLSNAPDGAAAARSAQRMTALEGVVAVVGGYGVDQYEALSRVAAERNVPFFNIGTPASRFRQQNCGRYTFHIEAEEATYLEALAHAAAGVERPFFVHREGAEGEALLALAQAAFGGTPAGASPVSDAPAYIAAVDAIRASDADLVVLLLDWRAQLDFMGLYDAFSLETRLVGFPYPVTQTRVFYRAAGDALSPPAKVARTAIWEATLAGSGAGELNSRFLGRFGRPMDGPAWAAYAAVSIVAKAALGAGGGSSDLVTWLEGPEATFELHKGSPLVFRASDRQLLQPLYRVEIHRAAETELEAASLLSTFETAIDGSTGAPPARCQTSRPLPGGT